MTGAPNIEPELSSGAMKLRRKKLDRIPWDHTGKHPGNPLFWKAIVLMMGIGLRYIFRSRHYDKIPDFEGGRVLSAIHLNGLVDPTTMVHSQDRRVISMGRHDLMTMPLIGWFSRRMGSQPVIRKSEIEKGVSDEEYARKINDRTLLTMTHCIASGHNALVMPEGKSHQDSRLHRFKTGPMRFALNAASIAQHRGLPLPALQPIGLHFRCHHWFRTDVFVEFQNPIPVDAPEDPGAAESLLSGAWEEPPSEQVFSLRDRLFSSLSEVTPDAPDWETYRAWHLIGHIRSNSVNKPLQTFKDEVLAARNVRDLLAGRGKTEDLLAPSIEAAKILHDHDLDGRSINGLKLRTDRRWTRALAGVFLMALAAPVTLPSTGAQALLAWYMGDRTDEGIDARTTYHFLAGMFSPILFWIPIAILASVILIPPSLATSPANLALSAAIVFLIHAANVTFLLGYDCWTDFSNSTKSARLAATKQGKRLIELIDDVSTNLNLL
ncbi:MAG: 1-acyl-sn-glycerol-3-phosphate acyltransferase [Candidatus Thalassarchaeaceae archaeon]|jgi:1-acyl-sn-glycerol-3-phosphate acyltransferase|nr:1-acyl-sn-glycerol-3-phosphate acyltransferase [Candidatus Thalassarchaeaceae archaeon]